MEKRNEEKITKVTFAHEAITTVTIVHEVKYEHSACDFGAQTS